jgi:hypothetical protein
LSVFGDSPDGFPKLPILDNAAPLRGQRQKYGALFYLGIVGLAILSGLTLWFGYSVWRLRDVWADVYLLHDPRKPAAQRIEAAFRLSWNSRLSEDQLMETSLRRDLPDLARYLLAEAVSTEAVARDPRGYALTVARSPDWPDWLRLLLARRLAYGAARGYAIPREALDELARHSDPMIGLWAACALALLRDPQSPCSAPLEVTARAPSESGELARLLLRALSAPAAEREFRLDEAAVWMRHHHAQAGKIWQDWTIRDGRLFHDGGM